MHVAAVAMRINIAYDSEHVEPTATHPFHYTHNHVSECTAIASHRIASCPIISSDVHGDHECGLMLLLLHGDVDVDMDVAVAIAVVAAAC